MTDSHGDQISPFGGGGGGQLLLLIDLALMTMMERAASAASAAAIAANLWPFNSDYDLSYIHWEGCTT